MPGTKVQEHTGSEKAMVFSCVDFADEAQKPELFCIRFASAERAQEFQKAYESAAAENEKLFGSGEEGEEEEEHKEEDEEGQEESEADKAAEELAAKATVADATEKKE